jgi:maleylpyruvate isomerase
MTATVRLHNYFRSSASWRVRIALAWKQVAYEYVAVSLVKDAHLTDAYRELNPLQAVPTLEIDGLRLAESLAILEYLEETRPEPPLLPKNPGERAQTRRIAEAVNAFIQPFQGPRVTKQLHARFGADAEAQKAWSAHFNEVGLAGVEALVRASAGRYCVGDDVSFADLCLVPQLYGARRFGVDVSAFPTLVKVEAELVKLPAFVAADPSNQPDFPTSPG